MKPMVLLTSDTTPFSTWQAPQGLITRWGLWAYVWALLPVCGDGLLSPPSFLPSSSSPCFSRLSLLPPSLLSSPVFSPVLFFLCQNRLAFRTVALVGTALEASEGFQKASVFWHPHLGRSPLLGGHVSSESFGWKTLLRAHSGGGCGLELLGHWAPSPGDLYQPSPKASGHKRPAPVHPHHHPPSPSRSPGLRAPSPRSLWECNSVRACCSLVPQKANNHLTFEPAGPSTLLARSLFSLLSS